MSEEASKSVTKTITIKRYQADWLQLQPSQFNFSGFVQDKLDEEIDAK